MIRPDYTKVLTPEERLACIKLGAIMKFGEHGIRVDQIDDFMKSADGIGAVAANALTPTNVLKTVGTLSLMTGVPIGIMAHIVSNKIKAKRLKERELEEKTKYYREATRQLEGSLSETNAMMNE